MKKNRLWALAGLGAVGGAIGLLAAGGLSENMVFFLTPSELEAKTPSVYGSPVRLGGQVKPNSVEWNAETLEMRFVMTDGTAEVAVESSGAPPQMFGDGIGVVVEGTYGEDRVFRSTNVMVKHSNEYQPPGEGHDPSDTYKSLIPEGSGS